MKYCKLIGLILVVVIFIGCAKKANHACYKAQCYDLELAISEQQKARGLQHRDRLDQDEGMLFFMTGVSSPKFWMKETLIPLDMIWLDELGTIVYIEHDAVPCEKDPCPTYGPNFPVEYVLEISSGEAARLDMHLGERVTLEFNDVHEL